MYKSSFHGVIEELPGVYVDNFERADEVQARAYFLSHCHSDHTQGLYSDTLIWALQKSGACIYMSEPTAAIIEDEATDKRIMKFIRPLKLVKNGFLNDTESTLILLPSDPQRNFEELFVTVTLIPAGHSFGSVMFLFRTTFKTILFTGDFRVSSKDLPKYKKLHNDDGPISIDALYMDTTFFSYRYPNFPLRSESVEATIEEIKKWLEVDSNGVALHTSAKYGYEFVYNEIYKRLGVKVYVNDNRWALYSKLSHLVPGVTNAETTRIHICRNNSEKKVHTNCMTTIKADTNILYIHFSAMKWDYFNIEDRALNKVSNNRIDVCFATHCSRKELDFFVKYFSPKKVVGFPEKYETSEVKKVTGYSNSKSTGFTKRKMAAIKDGGEPADKKVDRELLSKIFNF